MSVTRNGAVMLASGTRLTDKERNQQEWSDWLKRHRRHSQLTTFAKTLVAVIESQVGSPRPHVADVAENAMRAAGADDLTDVQIREVLQLLQRVWHYGPGIRNWARREGILKPGD